jgi:hypothetical protein
MDFRLNLQRHKCIMLVKALSISIGSYLLDRYCTLNVWGRNQYVAISLLTSSSMHYPKLKDNQAFTKTKLDLFWLSAVLMNLLKKQRDASWFSVFVMSIMPWKGSDRHHRMVLNALENLCSSLRKKMDTSGSCTKLQKNHRSMIIFLQICFIRLRWGSAV